MRILSAINTVYEGKDVAVFGRVRSERGTIPYLNMIDPKCDPNDYTNPILILVNVDLRLANNDFPASKICKDWQARKLTNSQLADLLSKELEGVRI